MKSIIRVVLLAVIVVLGFTVVFPEWFEFKDQVVAERQYEQAAAEQRQRDSASRQRYADDEAALESLQPQAEAFAEGIWHEVDSGNYAAPFDRATSRFQQAQASADVEQLRSIHAALGPKLDAAEAASKPGYNAARISRVYPSHGPNLIVESQRWSGNALAVRKLELMRESEQFKVDAIVLEVLMYPGEEGAIASDVTGPHVFR